MKTFLPAITLVATLSLSACGVPQEPASQAPTTATPVVKLEQQLESPAPRAEPAFRTSLALSAVPSAAKVGGKTTVAVVLTGLRQPATTFSTTLRVSEHLKITALKVNEAVLPMVFRSDIAADGRSASIAASNGKGFSGAEVALLEITVESLVAGTGSVAFDADDTSVLLPDNSNVAPQPAVLPRLTLGIQ